MEAAKDGKEELRFRQDSLATANVRLRQASPHSSHGKAQIVGSWRSANDQSAV